MALRLAAIASLLIGSFAVLIALFLIYPPAALLAGGAGLMSLGLGELRSKP